MKKIFGLAAVVSMVAVANVRVLLNENSANENLGLDNIEYMAEAESNPYNNFWTMWTQGITKDEREERRACPTSTSSSGGGYANGSYNGASAGAGGSGSHSQTNPIQRYEIICPYGYDNCTEVGC